VNFANLRKIGLQHRRRRAGSMPFGSTSKRLTQGGGGDRLHKNRLSAATLRSTQGMKRALGSGRSPALDPFKHSHPGNRLQPKATTTQQLQFQVAKQLAASRCRKHRRPSQLKASFDIRAALTERIVCVPTPIRVLDRYGAGSAVTATCGAEQTRQRRRHKFLAAWSSENHRRRKRCIKARRASKPSSASETIRRSSAPSVRTWYPSLRKTNGT
jgi:hypothetical protein